MPPMPPMPPGPRFPNWLRRSGSGPCSRPRRAAPRREIPGLRSRTRARMPVRSSRAIPRPVRSASVTMRLAMTWFVPAANRASLRARFFSSRFADLVFFAWSLARRCRARCRCRFRYFPQCRAPSSVVAMFAIPRSTPRNPAGSLTAGPGMSQVAYRNHLPSRCTRSDSPWRYSRSRVICAAEQAKRTSRSRPAVVQIDTVLRSSCQDRHLTSNGCAASARNVMGLAPAFTLRLEPGSPRFPARTFARRVA